MSRTRIFMDTSTVQNIRNFHVIAGITQTDVEIPMQETIHKEWMTDVETANFYKLRNQGAIINNPRQLEKITWAFHPTVYQLTGTIPNGKSVYTENYERKASARVPPASMYGNMSILDSLFSTYGREIDLAITRAHANVDVSEAMLGATLGELPETLNWLRSLLTRGITVTRVFRRKADSARALLGMSWRGVLDSDFSKLKRYAKTVSKRYSKKRAKEKAAALSELSNLWLEYRYAIRPLIYDLRTLLGLLDKHLQKTRATARGKERIYGRNEETVEYSLTDRVDRDEYCTEKVTTEEFVYARSGVLYTISDAISNLLRLLGLDKPVETLWELTPFSFIIDWFFSIGDLLSSWFKSSGLSVLTSWVTLRQVKKVTNNVLSFRITDKNGYRWTDCTYQKGYSWSVVTRDIRIPNPSIPALPRFDLKLDLAKIIDLGMIGQNMLLGRNVPQYTKRG